jgi:hypothetical protein
MTLTPWTAAPIAALLLVAPATAGDYHVDPVAGSDAASGTSPAEAWRTLTHALATVPDPTPPEVHTIHLAPGVYEPAGGEVFPLEMRAGIGLRGEGGIGAVVVRGTGTETLLRFRSLQSGSGQFVDEDTRVERLTLSDAAVGVALSTDWGLLAPTLEDLVVRHMSDAGLSAAGGGWGAAGPYHPVLRRVRFEDCAVGLRASTSGEGTSTSLTLEDVLVGPGSADGIRASNAGDGSRLLVRALRTRIQGRGADGVHLYGTNWSRLELELSACEVVGCADDGIELEPDNGLGHLATLVLVHTTLVDNADVGLLLDHTGDSGSSSVSCDLQGCILWGNGDDLRQSLESPPEPRDVRTAVACDIGDGDYLGVTRTFSADPLFRDAGAGDLRLAFGSPCIDAAPAVPGWPAGEPDLGGVVPPVDGDRDLLAIRDVGAREHAPLELGGEAHTGSPLELTVTGPVGGVARVFAARGPLLPSPLLQPQGEWWLPARSVELGLARTHPAAPAPLVLQIPADAALVGTSLSFQAEVRAAEGLSTASVWTNPVTTVVLP